MFEKIKQLGADTTIYGISTVAGRFLTFILTPLYANILPPDELGVVATMYAYIAFLNVVFGYGMESAYFRYSASGELGNPRQQFSVPFISVVLTSVVFSLLIALNASGLADVGGVPEEFSSIVLFAAAILFLDAIVIVPFALLRMDRKAKKFATIRLTSIVVNVASNVLFLVVYDRGIEGIFISNIISSALTIALLLPTIASRFTTSWNTGLYRALLRFGLPYVPAGLATMVIQVVDRPILESLTDLSTVGIYQANYRLGIFMMLIVSTFDFAWRPFFMSQASQDDAKPLFARILTYYLFGMTTVFLVLSFFLEDVVKIPVFWGRSILPETYWGGLSIVPVVLFAYMFLGVSNTMVAGIYIEKKTGHLPAITFIGAFVNIATNYLLIPLWGILGAALATLFSYAAMTVAVYVLGQRIYPVRYEWSRVAKILCASLAVFICHAVLEIEDVFWNIGLVGAFVAIMYVLKFFNREELRFLASLWKRARPV